MKLAAITGKEDSGEDAIRFDAKQNDKEAISEVVDMLTKAYVDSKTVKVRTALDEWLYNYNVAHVSLGDDGTSMVSLSCTCTTPLPSPTGVYIYTGIEPRGGRHT